MIPELIRLDDDFLFYIIFKFMIRKKEQLSKILRNMTYRLKMYKEKKNNPTVT